MSYGKLFASCYTGSMFGSGTDVFAVWGYVIAHAVDGQVELNPMLLAAILGADEKRMTAAIGKLCEPDPKSRNKQCGGRRLIKEGQFAYRVVSHAVYRHMRNEDERREYNRVKQAEHRARAKSKLSMTVIDVQSQSAMSAQAEAEAEAEAEAVGGRSHEPSIPVPPAAPAPSAPPPQASEAAREMARNGPTLPQERDSTADPPQDTLTNKPTLEQALRYFAEQHSGAFRAEEVRECYRLFEVTASAGYWYWGKRLVGDWRQAMMQRMLDQREKRGGKKPPTDAGEALKRELGRIGRAAGI